MRFYYLGLLLLCIFSAFEEVSRNINFAVLNARWVSSHFIGPSFASLCLFYLKLIDDLRDCLIVHL